MASRSLQNLNILMIAPSRVLAAVLRKELGDIEGVHIASCKNLGEAMAAMHEFTPDLVVSSMYFEDGDGIDFIRAIRTQTMFDNTLFMLMSSEIRLEMLMPARQAGVVAILSRPFARDALIQSVNIALSYRDETGIADPVDLPSLKLLLIGKHVVDLPEGQLITQVADVDSAATGMANTPFDIVFADYDLSALDAEKLLKVMYERASLNSMSLITVCPENDSLVSIKTHGVTVMLDSVPASSTLLKNLLAKHYRNVLPG